VDAAFPQARVDQYYIFQAGL